MSTFRRLFGGTERTTIGDSVRFATSDNTSSAKWITWANLKTLLESVFIRPAFFGDYQNGHYTNFNQTTGQIQYNNNASTWEDDNLDPTQLTGGGTAPTSVNIPGTNIKVASFVNNATDEVQSTREIPHKAKTDFGAAISFHAHCYPQSTNVGNFRLGLEYVMTRNGVVIGAAATIYAIGTTTGVAWVPQCIVFADIPVINELGVQFHFRFFRDGTAVEETYTGDVAISTIGYHYEIDSSGSNTISSKW